MMPAAQKVSVDELIAILWNCPTGLHMEQLESLLWKARKRDAEMPKQFRIAIYSALSLYTSQSLIFRQKRKSESQDLFYSPAGKGSGTWAVRRQRAEAWLRKRLPASRQDAQCR